MGIKHAEIPAGGSLAGTALTGSYQTLLDASDDDIRILMIFNSCDTDIVISVDGGTTNQFIVPSFRSFVVDLKPLEMAIAIPTISAKHNGSVPTAGIVSATVMR